MVAYTYQIGLCFASSQLRFFHLSELPAAFLEMTHKYYKPQVSAFTTPPPKFQNFMIPIQPNSHPPKVELYHVNYSLSHCKKVQVVVVRSNAKQHQRFYF